MAPYPHDLIEEREKKMFRGFLLGVIAGGALALLFAPQRGQETRTQLQSRLNSLQQETQSRMGDLREKSGPVLDQVRQTVNSTLNKAQSATNTVADNAPSSLNGTGE